MISPEEIARIHDNQQEMLKTLTSTSTRLEELCKKFDKFLDTGGVRCATHTEQIRHNRRGIKVIFAWLAGLTSMLLGAFIQHITG